MPLIADTNEHLDDLIQDLQKEIGYANERIKFHEEELTRHRRTARNKIEVLVKLSPEAEWPV